MYYVSEIIVVNSTVNLSSLACAINRIGKDAERLGWDGAQQEKSVLPVFDGCGGTNAP